MHSSMDLARGAIDNLVPMLREVLKEEYKLQKCVYRIEELSDMNSKTFGGEEKSHFGSALVEVSGKPSEVDTMRKIFLDRYYDLPRYLRTCLLFMSILPEEYLIDEKDLILRWTAEGFISKEEGKQLFDIGFFSDLHELLDRSMVIQIDHKGSGPLVGYRVHDMVLPLIHDLLVQDNNIRRSLALHISEVDISSINNMLQVMLFNDRMIHTKMMLQASIFNRLRLLDLQYCIGMEDYHLEVITDLIYLKFLRLSHTPVRRLPKNIGRLKLLQALILNCTGLKGPLPESMFQLTQLSILDLDMNEDMPMPEPIRNFLTSLGDQAEKLVKEFIKEFVKKSAKEFEKELSKLTNLTRVLMQGINVQNEGNKCDLLESLRNMKNIQNLDISFPNVFLPMDGITMEPSSVLSSCLKVLDSFHLLFPSFLAWFNDKHLPNVFQINMVVHDQDDLVLKILRKFRGLRQLLTVMTEAHVLELSVHGYHRFKNFEFFYVKVPLNFGHEEMVFGCCNFVISLEVNDGNMLLKFKPSFRSVVSGELNCADICHMKVHYDADTVLRCTIDFRPSPPYEVGRTGIISRLKYKAAEMACSMPEEPPNVVTKVLRRLQQISFTEDSTSRGDDISSGLNILEQRKEPSNLKLPLLELITDNFSDELKVGCGGCGEVYKGILRDGTTIAVKKLFNKHTVDDKMFHQEVLNMIKVRHQNTVRLLGYCSHTEEQAIEIAGNIVMAQKRERLLCFEYISNGGLQDYITDELRGLEWNTRYQIIKGICDGLSRLHAEHIIHMDLKPANILLDDNMVPKITDFGLSRLDDETHTNSVERLFSIGYCAPEYLNHGKLSAKSDIYSLGIIILEIATGSKEKPTISKVLKKWRHRWSKKAVHTPLWYKQVTNCLNLALRCTHHSDPTHRPFIWDIIRELKKTDEEAKDATDEFQELEDMLGVDPLIMHLFVEHNKQISHSLELTNNTDGYFAFRISTNSLRRYDIQPSKDIVAPQSKCRVTITLQALEKAPPRNYRKDDFSVQSTRVDASLSYEDICEGMFNKETADSVNLTVVLDL